MSCLTSSLRKVSSTSSRRSISRCERSRSWRISRSPPSRTLRRTSDLAPSASSSARSASSFCWRASTLASRAPSRFEVAVPRLVVHRGDQVGREVDDLLEVLGRQVQQVAQARRDTLEKPDVGDRSGQLDVAHPLATDLRPGHLDAAALADDALEPDPLVLTAVALPVPGGTEDLLAEETVLLRTQGPVVDGLGLLHLTVRPLADVVAGGQADAQLIEEVDVEQVDDPFPGLVLRFYVGEWWPAGPDCSGPAGERSDVLDARGLAAAEVDAQLLRGPEDLVVSVAQLDRVAVA